jgi:hypothetical protein
MGTRSRRGATVAGLLVLLLTACGNGSDPSPPTGVDHLVIPTPSVDPDDFVTGVDNPWLPLPIGATWTYDLTGAAPGAATVTTSEGPYVGDVPTTAVRTSVAPEGTRPTVTIDFYAQDDDGNVWWFGRQGEWQADEDDARAGLVMAAHPRLGDGYRQAYAEGVVDRRAEVTGVGTSRSVPAGTYDDLVSVTVTSPLSGVTEEVSYAEGVGPVLLQVVDGGPETQLGLVAYDEP